MLVDLLSDSTVGLDHRTCKIDVRAVQHRNDIEYIRLTDNDYRILGRTSRVILSYSSAEPIDDFVGNGVNVFDATAIDS